MSVACAGLFACLTADAGTQVVGTRPALSLIAEAEIADEVDDLDAD